MRQCIDPQFLVCDACWISIFSTANFRSLCEPFREDKEYGGPEYVATLPRIEKAAAGGCTWCSLILAGVNSEGYLTRNLSTAGEMHVSLASFGSQNENYTPAGKNRALILINGYPLHPTVFTTNDNIVGEIVTARELENQVNSIRATQQIHKWLVECDQHKKCGPIEPSLLPRRVIEVSPKKYPRVPRLFITKGEVDYYAALSYCWGADQKGLTTIRNFKSRLEWLDTTELSQSLQDAITTTRKIGIKYLWIDALCIIQDSVDDKVIELASMCRTYQHASVTIVAASASSAHEGFLEDRQPPKPSYQIPFWAPNGKLSSVALRLEDNYDDDEREPINRRAWTLQEQLLSPRLLIYATHTLQYHCQHHTVNLGNSINIPAGFIPRRLPGLSNSTLNNWSVQAMGRAWGEIVGMYSQRQLSHLDDKLTALGGVAEVYASQANMKYLAGLWSGESLPRLLLWRVQSMQDYIPCPFYTAPSWSWASLKSPVFYSYFQSQYNYQWYEVDVISCDIVLENVALPFGRVTDGHLKLIAYVRRGFFDTPRSVTWCPSALQHENNSVDMKMSALLDDSSSSEKDVLCVAIARRTSEKSQELGIEPVIDGLIISSLLPPVGSKGIYRRVGCFVGLKEKEFKGFTRETVTLV